MHIELVGRFNLTMRESDDALTAIACVLVNWSTAAIERSGELCQPIDSQQTMISNLSQEIMHHARSIEISKVLR